MPLAYIKFFGTDWRSDPELRLCSAAARGVWIDCLTLMMAAEPAGYLLVNGKPATAQQIAVLTCTPVAVVTKALRELRANAVSHQVGDTDHPDDIRDILRTDLPTETIFNRKMIRSIAASEKGKAFGKAGGNPKLKGNGNPPINDNGIREADNAPGYGGGLTPPDNTHSHSHSQYQNPEEEAPPDGGTGGYAFRGQVVRLKLKDYRAWKAAFSAIPDLDAELTSLDTFYAGLPEKDRKNWFIRCSTALNNKHQEHLARRPKVANDAAPRPQANPQTNPLWRDA